MQWSKWRAHFIQGGKSELAQKGSSDTRDKGIEDLKKIVGDQRLALDGFKKSYEGG